MARATSIKRESRFTGLSVGPKLIMRQIRSDLAVIGSLLVVVFITSLFLSATPQLFNEMSDDGLRQTIRDASPILRNVSVGQSSRIVEANEDDVFAFVDRDGVEFREEEMPESLQAIIDDQQYVVDSPRFVVSAPPGEPQSPFPTFIRMRYQQQIGDHVRLVAGRLPQPSAPVPLATGDGGAEELVPLYEIAVTEETLAELRVGLGDRLILTPDRDDILYRGIPISQLDYRLALEITGIIEPTEPDEAYWYNDYRLHRPQIVENPDFVLIFTMGLMSPADYQKLLDDTGQALWSYTWRYFVNPDLMDAGNIDQLAADIRNLEVSYSSIGLASLNERSLTTGLSRLINQFLDQRRLTISTLALASIGLFAVSLAVVALLASLITVRRRNAIVLLRSRGATRRQLTISRITEGLFLSVPAALLAYVVAVLLIPGRLSLLSFQAALILSIATTVLIVLAALPVIHRDLGSLQRDEDIVERPSNRRRVAEIVVIAVAVGAVVLLRRRGLAAESLANGDISFDPLLAAVPALLGLAVGIVTLRLYVYPVRLFAWFGSLRRDLVIFVGFRRILQQPPAARLPLLVILLAVAVAVFASIIRLSIEDGQQESTWQEVGADYRITPSAESAPLSRLLDLSEVDSIEASALGYRVPTASIVSTSLLPGVVDFLALETDNYNVVTAGTPADAKLPEVLVDEQIIQDIGTESNPIPAIVSRQGTGNRSLSTGDTFSLDLGRIEATFIVREVRERFPGMPLDRPFVIANISSIDEINRRVEIRPTVLYLRAPESTQEEIDTTMRSQTLSTRLTSRFKLYSQIHDAPLVSGVSRGFQFALVLAAVFAIVAAIAALVLTSQTRIRDFGYLRTLGLSSRQAIGLTIIEQLPPVIIASIVGSLLGLAIAILIEPGIDLNAFTGPGLPAELQIDATAIAVITVGLTVAVLLAIGVFSYFTRDENLGSVLRLGDE